MIKAKLILQCIRSETKVIDRGSKYIFVVMRSAAEITAPLSFGYCNCICS